MACVNIPRPEASRKLITAGLDNENRWNKRTKIYLLGKKWYGNNGMASFISSFEQSIIAVILRPRRDLGKSKPRNVNIDISALSSHHVVAPVSVRCLNVADFAVTKGIDILALTDT